MSSSNKTANLKLNSWLGSDSPKREDFNNDNQIIDNAISAHIADQTLHIVSGERDKWNKPYYLMTYYGNGAASRTLSYSGAGFTPSWGIIFALNYPPSVADFANESNYNYFAVFSTKGCTAGVSYTGNQLTVIQSSAAVMKTEFRNMNATGVTYACILFR